MNQLRIGGKFATTSQLKRKQCGAEALQRYHNENKAAKRSKLDDVGCVIGSRIVEIEYLIEQLICNNCHSKIHLSAIQSETRRGLASIFRVKCDNCKKCKIVYSSRKTATSIGNSLFNINCNAALGCIDSGIGYEQLNSLLLTMDIAPPFHQSLKLAENRMGQAFIDVANISFKAAIQEELDLTLCALSSTSLSERPYIPEHAKPGITYITVTYDFGWSKRGYDSKSGRGSVYGALSKKLLAVDTFSTACSMCLKGHDPSSNSCCKNWFGSSKSMEAAMAVKLMVNNHNFHEKKVCVGTLIGDDDSSTYAAVQQNSPHLIIKLSDSNHVRKKFTASLYKMSAVYKDLNKGNVIAHLKKCFNYALDQNKTNAVATSNALKNIADHVFGEHSKCGNWCKAKGNSNYVYRSLPNGKALNDIKLKEALQELLRDFTSRVVKIAHGGSSQPNESFNNMVALKAPKNKHYAGSRSHQFRTAAAACQQNLGASHIISVKKQAGLPIGKNTLKHKLISDIMRQKKASKQSTLQYKQQRLKQKSKKLLLQSSKERKEGISYESDMNSTISFNFAAHVDDRIPDDCTLVICDIEITGLSASADIIQIAAKCGEEEFTRYILPMQRIDAKATTATGFEIIDGQLQQRGVIFRTTPPRQAAEDFLGFLETFESKILLVGHNIIRFDAPRIMKWLEKLDLLPHFLELVCGVSDTYCLIKQGKIGKQEELARMYLVDEKWKKIMMTAHNASTDCIILDALLKHFKISDKVIVQGAKSMKYLLERFVQLKNKKIAVQKLQCLKKTISDCMIAKIATAGITMQDLRDYYKSGPEAVKLALSMSIIVDGKTRARVPTNKRIINAITDFLAEEKNLKVF